MRQAQWSPERPLILTTLVCIVHPKSKYCDDCGARMDLNGATPDRCRNYIDCDGSCYIDDSPCECGGNIEKCKGRDTE